MTVRARFAPSPTGPIHIGNIRTALFNYLYTKSPKVNGTFILRIEDTDLERSTKEYEGFIMQELKWLGLEWDEGPDKEGSFGPYRQTERLEYYNRYCQLLIDKKAAFKCFCSPEELERQREELSLKGEMPRYIGGCDKLSKEETDKLIAQGRQWVVRFKVPQGEIVIFNDIIKGEITVKAETIGDFVIIKSDGIPTYNFACVVDDYMMGITHVIRGEDHIPNTPKQILIYNALELPVPLYAHSSMILGPDRTKLSKRHGDNYIGQYRDKGYLPEALFNFLSLLGWSPEGDQEILTKEEIINQFSIEKIVKSPAVFDIDKLNWMNSVYIKQTDNNRLLELCKDYLIEEGYITEVTDDNREMLLGIIDVVKGSLSYLLQIKEKAKIFFESNVLPESEEAKEILKGEYVKELIKAFGEKVEKAVVIDSSFIENSFKELKSELGLGGKKLFMPIRIAITGKLHGPDLPLILPVMGRKKILEQIMFILDNIN